jgi:hypothetical protein
VNYTCRYTTDNFNADTMNNKICHRLMVISDQYAATGTSNLSVTFSDNDWADGGSTARTLNLFGTNPYLKAWGTFRQRSWRFEYADNYPLRINSVMLDLNIGMH